MATNTPKLNLIKPDVTDPVDIADLNSNMDVLDNAFVTAEITTPSAGQKLVFDGTNWVNLDGYVYVDTIYYTSNGTFVKADYPWLRAIRVRLVGGGGSGGSSFADGSSLRAGSGGGGGGGYAEAFITDIAGLDASVSITRGNGAARPATGDTDGLSGGTTSFGSLVVATGGNGGRAANSPSSSREVRGGVGTAGDFLGWGGPGYPGSGRTGGARAFSGAGGDSFLGGGGNGGHPQDLNGINSFAQGFGGGGGGTVVLNQSRAGGAGANGIVIVELYA